MEIWELMNENREPLGREHVRGEKLPEGCYHLVVHVWLRNSKGEYMISRRSPDRPTFPLMWECVGGSVVKGEDSLIGAIREVKEEVGVDLTAEQGKLLFSRVRGTIDGVYFGDILDVWIFDYDGPSCLDRATTREVSQVEWMTKAQIRQLYDAGQLVPTLSYFFHRDEF